MDRPSSPPVMTPEVERDLDILMYDRMHTPFREREDVITRLHRPGWAEVSFRLLYPLRTPVTALGMIGLWVLIRLEKDWTLIGALMACPAIWLALAWPYGRALQRILAAGWTVEEAMEAVINAKRERGLWP